MAKIYKFGADASDYIKTLQTMRNQTMAFSSNISGLMKGAFAFVGISGLKNFKDELVSIQRNSAKLRMSAKDFQIISNAAKTIGMDADRVADAIKDLNVKITDGALGAKAYAEVFDLIGLSLAEVVNMSPAEQFYAFADAVKQSGDQLGKFGLDEINDAMFDFVPLMLEGSENIKKLGGEMGVFSDTALNAAVDGTVKFERFMHKLKVTAGETYDIFAKLGRVVKEFGPDFKAPTAEELAKDKEEFKKPLKQRLDEALKDPSQGKQEQEGKLIELAESLEAAKEKQKKQTEEARKEAERVQKVEEKTAALKIKTAQEIEDASLRNAKAKKLEQVAASKLAKLQKELKLFKDDFNKSADHALAVAEKEHEIALAKTKLLKAEDATLNDQLNTREKIKKQVADLNAMREDIKSSKIAREEQDLSPNERLEKSTERRKKIEADLAKLIKSANEDNKTTYEEALGILKKQLELESAIVEEKRRGKALIDSENKSRKREKEHTSEIAAERKRREEMGMSDEEILARRKSELAQAEEAFAALGEDANNDGKVDEDDEIFRNKAELDIERRKSEIKGLEQGLQPGDPQAGVIASSLAAIGGGGGVASFGNDPMLNENKKQTTVLEGIKQAIENQNRGEEVLLTPEL